MNKSIGFLCCLTGFALCVLFGLLAAVHVVGTDAALYHELQMRAGILPAAGISEADLIRLDEALSQCLRGKEKALYLSCEVFGAVQPAFNPKELIHMEDCRQLFMLLRTVIRAASILGPLFLTLGCVLLRGERRKIRLAACLAPLLIAVPLGLFAAWAALDFDAAFTLFHELLFTNELWLLNPATDLLIRICPASMFMAMGARIAGMALAWAVFVPALTAALTHQKRREHHGIRSAYARKSE